MWRRDIRWLALVCAVGLAGCTSDMWTGSKLMPLDPSPVFANDNSSRPSLPDTVARGSVPQNAPQVTGLAADGKPVDTLPVPLTRALLDRGQQRFNIYCAPCHGRAGDGNGMIVRRGFPPPPSYHTDRLRRAPIGHFVDVMTHGFGAMYSYADRVAPPDRWAIAAYIRALQLSQHAPAGELPPDVMQNLRENAGTMGGVR